MVPDGRGAPQTEGNSGLLGFNDAPLASAHPWIGRVLGGQYLIEQHLGTGGFGDVYRAVQKKTGQQVALKLLKARYGTGAPTLERQLARFRREMKVCAGLHHPHIVRIIDSGETESGVLYSVFEYVPGSTLAELLREKGALTVHSTIALMTQVLDALVCAHGTGVVHRDLKPNNIMVSTTGARPQATVVDFGISAFLEGVFVDELKSLTGTREVLGTPCYAAPEQLRGEEPTVKTDLYAWGLVFLECLLGRRVMDGPSPIEVAHRQLAPEPIPLPGRLQRHWLGNILRWTVEKDLARRAGDASLLMERLAEKRGLDEIVDGHGFFTEIDAAERHSAGGSEPPTSAVDTTSTGERRQLTAVCCSMAVLSSTRPRSFEALDEALRQAQALCLRVAARFGGHAAGNIGGQVMVFFGYPRASDSDTRRAAVVALEIAHELRRSKDLPIEIRIGIHTGVVTVSPAELASPSPIFGVTPAHAAMLALQAPANEILVSAETFQYLSRSFELESNRSTGGEQLYRLIGESRAESAVPGASRVPFIGRMKELAILEASWNSARDGRGETVIVRGEAGIGKSRLAREFRSSLEKTRARWLEARCLPEMDQSPLRPIVDLLARELNLMAKADGASRLETSLRNFGFDPSTAMPLLCPWLGVPGPEDQSPLSFSPQRQKALLLNLVSKFLLAIAEAHAAPILIEDLHWADPTTVELIDRLVHDVVNRRCLLLLTTRPDAAYEPPEGLARLLALESLNRTDVEQIVDALAGPAQLSPMLVEDVVQRADGIPLFVEEIVHFIEDAAAQSTALNPLERAKRRVPASLRDLLTGRLDQLGRAKETAQIAAVVGREFDYRLLARVVPDESMLLADLEKMVSVELLIRRRHVDNPVYIFRHALIRDAAYESLLLKNQQTLHGRVARALVECFPEIAQAHPELMAGHYERAGMVREAIAELLRAGQLGLNRGANRETVTHLRQAIALLDALPDENERMRVELELQLALAPAHMAIQGWASAETGAACTRARDLCEALGDRVRLFPSLWGLWTFQFVRGNLEPALTTARETLTMADEFDSPKIRLAARHAVAFTHLMRGDFTEAKEHALRGIALFDPDVELEVVRNFQISSTGTCSYIHAASLWMLGYPEDSDRELSSAHRLAKDLDHAPNWASMMGFSLFLLHYRQDVQRVQDTAEALWILANEHGFQNWVATSFLYRAWARAKRGELQQGINELEHGIEQFLAISARICLVGFRAMLAEVLIDAKRFDKALEVLDDGLSEAATRHEQMYAPDLHRLRGEALCHRDPSAAEDAFREAMRTAHGQKARSLSLRAAIRLAKLTALRDKGTALGLLQEEYAWFTQGFGTTDIREARALLDELADAS